MAILWYFLQSLNKLKYAGIHFDVRAFMCLFAFFSLKNRYESVSQRRTRVCRRPSTTMTCGTTGGGCWPGDPGPPAPGPRCRRIHICLRFTMHRFMSFSRPGCPGLFLHRSWVAELVCVRGCQFLSTGSLVLISSPAFPLLLHPPTKFLCEVRLNPQPPRPQG